MSEEIMNNVVATEPTTNNVVDNTTKKAKKKKSKARIIIEWILFVLFGLIFAFIIAGNISGEIHKKENYGQSIRFGIGSFIVLTDSMEPEIPKSSAIITYKEDLEAVRKSFEKGAKIDITFANERVVIPGFVPDTPEYQTGEVVVTNRVMTHRLKEIHYDATTKYGQGRYIFVASGINNEGEQSKEGQYQVFTEKQYLGTVKVTNVFLGKVFNFIVSPIGLIIVLLVPAGYLIVTSTIDIFKTLKTAEEAESVASSEGRLASLNDAQKEKLKRELLDQMIEEKRKAKEQEKKDEIQN